jgi:hypothetical protein
LVPLFPELYTELVKLFESESSLGMEYVINRYRDPERSNVGTQFARIVKMAGIEPIPRPFDNMRASRSTEVYAEFGAFYESKWIGHSARVARECYLQMREEDFERAVGEKPSTLAGENNSPALGKISPAKVPAAQGSNTLHRIEGNRQAKTANS